MSVISEAILLIGVILIGLLFFVIAGDMLGHQAETVFATAERNIAEEIKDRANTLEGFKGVSRTNYHPGVSQYTLEVRQSSILEVQVEGRDVHTAEFQDVRLVDTAVENEDTLCIEREGDAVEITGGACDELDLSDYCADDRCETSGSCEVDFGEQCTSADCDCTPEQYPDDADTEDVSEHCQPDYDPDDYIDGDGPPTIDPIGCVSEEYVDVQDEEERCDYDFECSGDMACEEPHPDAEGDGERCCPEGERWNGEECSSPETYDIVYSPLNYGSGDFNAFQSQAERAHDFLVPQSPFGECENPENHIRAHYLEDMSGSCPSGGRAICNECPQEALDRVRASELGNTYDVVAGICQGNSCNTGGICGCAAGIPSEASVSQQQPCGDWEGLVAHEVGHSWGLYHVEECGAAGGCAGPNAQDCSEPDRRNFIMSYCSMSQFGPAAYDHLENDVFDRYLEGCT